MMPLSFELSGRDIHIWTVRPLGAGIAAKFEPVLSLDERDRAARFRFENSRASFVVTRGILRTLLGKYLGIDAAAVRFSYGPNGKPALAAGTPIEFNASHSDDMATLAFTRGCQLGIDLELIRPLNEVQLIAESLFCPAEAASIRSLSPPERIPAFFGCWARKEAYIKAIGAGLSTAMDTFRVLASPSLGAGPICFEDGRSQAENWTLQDLPLAPCYAAALAYADRERPVSVFPVPDPLRLIP